MLRVDDEAEALVAEWVAGPDLRALLDEAGPMPPALAAFVAREAARGLAAVHAAGILHRDVSAANVLVGHDGAVKLTDFGFATLAPDPADREVRGTLATIAPEVVHGEPPTPAADLFSLGAVLTHALTGRPAFEGATTGALLDAVFNADPAAALAADPRVPAPLAALAGALLDRDPAARPPADEVADRLTALLPRIGDVDAAGLAAYLADPAGYRAPRPAPTVVEADASPAPHRVASARVGRRAVVLGGLVLVGVALGALALATRQRAEPPPGPRTDEPLAAAPVEIATPAPPEPDTPSAAPRGALPSETSDTATPTPNAGADGPPAALPRDAAPDPPAPLAPSEPPPPSNDAARPPPDRPGRLALTVEPWARVRTGGRDLGVTPFEPVALPAGEHVLTLSNPDFPTHTVRVRVDPGGTTQTDVSLWDLVGRVTLEVSPWATVSVDGVPWDTVPPQDRFLVLAPGDHVLGFDHPQLGRREVPLRIDAGEARTVRVRMDDAAGR